MANFTRFPSSSTMFSAYASVSASIMLVQTTFNQLVPRQLQEYISSAIRYYFKPQSSKFVLIIEENDGISSNEIYKAAEVYLSSKIDTSLQSLKISKRPKETGIRMRFARCEKIADFYEGVEITWRFNSEEMKKGSPKFIEDDSETTYTNDEKRFFELSFKKEYKEKVIDFYIPFVLQRAKDIRNEKKVVKLHTLIPFSYSSGVAWESINLEHPTTFENIAMEKSLKQAIIDDLDRFVMRKDFYRKVGKAWKRGYLLHGPPGTGKSSLVAAIANYLKFDVYDLELSSIKRDSDLRRLLLKTANRSILVIEDIDCSVTLPNRKKSSNSDGPQAESQLPFTLSGLLNFIDGLWSSCGDERIIVFTTNNKDKLDPALLRPGRMDMHICMSYISIDGCKQLISNYLNMDHHHQEHEHVHEIEGLIGNMNVTPAEVAGELMKSDDAEVSLVGLVNFLKRKKIDDEEKEIKNEGAEENEVEVELPKSKKLKLDINEDAVPNMDNGLKFDFLSEIVI